MNSLACRACQLLLAWLAATTILGFLLLEADTHLTTDSEGNQ